MSFVQPANIHVIAESLGLRVKEEAAQALAPDVEYRLREIIQVGGRQGLEREAGCAEVLRSGRRTAEAVEQQTHCRGICSTAWRGAAQCSSAYECMGRGLAAPQSRVPAAERQAQCTGAGGGLEGRGAVRCAGRAASSAL